MSWVYIALLACAVAVLVGAEWPALGPRIGIESRRKRERAKRKSNLKLLRNESDEFAASVQRDLENLPTTKERDRRN